MTDTYEVIPFLDLALLHKPLKPAMLQVLSDALDTSGFIGGKQVSLFEEEFAAFCGSPACAAVASGTDAVRLGLQGLGVGPGDTVVTVPNTFIATTEAISQTGARFEFVDIDPATSLMDMNLLEERLKRSPRPKAVVPVHLYGQCVDMGALRALARKYEFFIVEDACQAHGATFEGKPAGSLGDAGAFSFYPGKNLGACGEGGAVTSGDAKAMETMKMLRDHGQARKYVHKLEGTNARLDAVQAGFLRLKLPHVAGWNEQRRAVSDRYDQAFSSMGFLRTVAVLPGNVPARHLYVVHLADRDALAAHLGEKNIQTGLHYPIPLHLQECYASMGFSKGDFPRAEAAASELLSLPLFPGMREDQVDRVIAEVAAFGGKA